MAKTSPTQRSLSLLRERGYTVAVVEHWNAFAHIRQDLFGFGDLIAIRTGEILLVQTTTAANMAARRAKIAAEPRSALWIAAGGTIEIHGWAKRKPRGQKVAKWEAKIESVMLLKDGG